MDVAVKVLHHDAQTAASVANEVDLVMSFRCVEPFSNMPRLTLAGGDGCAELWGP
jgi:hypothetical protein